MSSADRNILESHGLPRHDLVPGTPVVVHYLTAPSINATVVEPPTRSGWVKVEQPYLDGSIQFDAAVEHVEIRESA